MSSGPSRSPARTEILALLAIVLVGAILRFCHLGAQSLWIDEYLMIQRASLGEPFRWADLFVNPQGPLPALILRGWTQLAGTSEWALRFPSAVFGTLTVPFLYLAARRIEPSAGLPAAALGALSPFLVWYSQETRHYALALLAAAGSTWAILRFEKARSPSLSDVALLSSSLLVGMLSNLTMTFFALAQFSALALTSEASRRKLVPWIVAVLPVFLVTLPWFWVTATQNLNLDHVAQAGPIPSEDLLRGESTFTWWGLPYAAFVFFAGYSLGPPLAELHAAPRFATVLPHLPWIVPLAAGVLVLVVAGLRETRRHPFARNLLVLTFAFSTVIVVVLSLRNAKVFNPRYLAIGLPLLLAVCGAGWERLRKGSGRSVLLTSLLVLVPTFVSLRNYHGDGDYAREDVRSAARVIDAEDGPDDIILGVGAPQVLKWYYKGMVPMRVVHQVWVRDPVELERRLDDWVSGRRRVWLLVSRPWLEDPGMNLKALLDSRYGPPEYHRFDGVLLALYDLR